MCFHSTSYLTTEYIFIRCKTRSLALSLVRRFQYPIIIEKFKSNNNNDDNKEKKKKTSHSYISIALKA